MRRGMGDIYAEPPPPWINSYGFRRVFRAALDRKKKLSNCGKIPVYSIHPGYYC